MVASREFRLDPVGPLPRPARRPPGDRSIPSWWAGRRRCVAWGTVRRRYRCHGEVPRQSDEACDDAVHL